MYQEILEDEEVLALIEKGNENLGVLGYTDHSEIHTRIVAERGAYILEKLGYGEEEIELVKVAGFMHDIGNAIGRKQHAEYGGILANEILKKYNLDSRKRIKIVSAITHHDESTIGATDEISAALIIADKTDVRRNRVRGKAKVTFDIHDRVNYAVTGTTLDVDKEKHMITLNLEIDEDICTMYEYFDIFLGRMLMCRKAAELLGCCFKIFVNGRKIM